MYGFASYLLTRRALTLATLPLDEILGQYETDTRE
jgi:hypothetical protein